MPNGSAEQKVSKIEFWFTDRYATNDLFLEFSSIIMNYAWDFFTAAKFWQFRSGGGKF